MAKKKVTKGTGLAPHEVAPRLPTTQEENESICRWLGWERQGLSPYWIGVGIDNRYTPNFSSWDAAAFIFVRLLNSGRSVILDQDGEVDIFIQWSTKEEDRLCAPTIPLALRAAALTIIQREKKL